ncbi:site-specific integrase [Lederbergia sp. NSJ-179]|uniref:tyrosine-type recombinase/integrase n=1 Tax=Lederbergia sp. NSJ-179 TaxID=2931402 RepID=UPI001FD5CA9F|nr:site-specific integrase [Lederbergia sp. NSJ-179]MCJ7842613.1 site-specific integrase [Lederbergia sp. NSJ-179]
MAKTKYKGVYTDNKGNFFYNIELGVDKITGERIQKKSRKNANGEKFKSAREANKEATRIRNEYLSQNGYANYRLTFGDFMDLFFLPYYQSSVEEDTWASRKHAFELIKERFSDKRLREIDVRDCESFRTWLLNETGYSQNYSALLYGGFRQALEYAVNLEFLEKNISKKTKAIPKAKSVVGFWTKEEFEKVISMIYTHNFYEHMCFVAIWLYYMTGVRVSEGLALYWNDVDFDKKKLRVHHTLQMKSKKDFKRKPYTKTEDGIRTISLDDDTLAILQNWKQVQSEHGIDNFILSYTGLPVHRSTIHRIVQRYAKIAKVTVIQAKGLRHSHVSYLINEFNADVLVVSRRLGHSSPEITLKHYAHLWSRNDEPLAEKMAGNIKFNFSKETYMDFNGNQDIKMELVPYQNPAIRESKLSESSDSKGSR